MTFNPDTDPHILENRRQTAEYNRQAEASMERLRKAMAQTQISSNATDNTTEKIIEEPFVEADSLSADDIVEGVEQDGKTIVHNVMDGEKVLFSTVSQPLAFAFIQGHNTAAKAVKDAKTEKGDDGKGDPAEVDPKNPPSNKSGAAGEKIGTGETKPSPSDTRGSQAAGEGRKAEKSNAAPRKRVAL